MKKFTQIFIILWKIHFSMVFLLSMLLLYPLFYITLSFKKLWPIGFVLQRFWSYIISTFIGIFVVKRNPENFPKGPFIVCPNHSSYLDIILMYQVVPRNFIFLGKQEIESWPLFNIFFTKGMHILVDRKNPIKAQKSFLKGAKELDKGNSLIIFPEGTIWPFSPKLKPFKNGAFKMAIEKQLPIVPITFTKNYKLLKTGAFFKAPGRPGISEVIIHKPIDTKGMTEDDLIPLRNKVFEIIQSPFNL